MARPGRQTLLRAVAIGGCLAAVLSGCGGPDTDPSRVAAGEPNERWPWEVHPPDPTAQNAEDPIDTVAGPTAEPTTTDVGDADGTGDADGSDDGSGDDGDDQGGESTDPGDVEESGLETEVVALTNEIRDEHGCDGDLRIDERLIEAARDHSVDMADRDFFDHTSPDGDGPGDRAAVAGYDAWGGENIAFGYSSAEEVVDAWMDSDGHRANILNCGFVAIGVGVADSSRGLYWTQSFGWE